MSSALFACTKCNERFLFEELSKSEHLCKNCIKLISTCTYCREEFQLESKHSKESICKRCSHYVQKYGLPSTCKYCNLISAFIGSKCERCSIREKKYGPPLMCEQCQQKSAFVKADKLNEKKRLCWLCARSYKKLLLKSGIKTTGHHSSKHAKHNHPKHAKIGINESKMGSSQKNSIQTDLGNPTTSPKRLDDNFESFLRFAKEINRKTEAAKHSDANAVNNKRKKIETHVFAQDSNGKIINAKLPISPKKSSKDTLSISPVVELLHSDQFLVINRLQDEVDSLKKVITEKDRQLLEKEKKMTQLKAEHFENDKVYRHKLQTLQREHLESLSSLQNKNRELQREISLLITSNKQNKLGNATTSNIFNYTNNASKVITSSHTTMMNTTATAAVITKKIKPYSSSSNTNNSSHGIKSVEIQQKQDETRNITVMNSVKNEHGSLTTTPSSQSSNNTASPLKAAISALQSPGSDDDEQSNNVMAKNNAATKPKVKASVIINQSLLLSVTTPTTTSDSEGQQEEQGDGDENDKTIVMDEKSMSPSSMFNSGSESDGDNGRAFIIDE